MNVGQTVFSQVLEYLPRYEFRKCVARYRGDYRNKGFSCWDQFLAMAFAQLTYRESLRDIEACLRALGGERYNMGFRSTVARSTLADANERRDWHIYADSAQVLIGLARPLYAEDPMGVELDQGFYALDSTTIDLCLSLFPWARFRRRKAAVKMHTLLDLHGNIPAFIHVTDGKVHDVNVLDHMAPEAGAFYVMDRAYADFKRLFLFTLCSAFLTLSFAQRRTSFSRLSASPSIARSRLWNSSSSRFLGSRSAHEEGSHVANRPSRWALKLDCCRLRH